MLEAINRVLPSVLEDLQALIRIPSVSSQPEHDADVRAAAERVETLFREAGGQARQLEAGGKPAVLATFPGPEDAPSVLLYAHYDVQPTGDPALWTSPAFEPTVRDGRLYSRGSADDKGGIGVHLAALRVFDGKPPVTVKVFVEGEEEIGSPSMAALLERYGDELSADVFVIADAINWEAGTPALTTTLRGLVDADVTVSTLGTGLHSGQFGGVVPDALTAMAKLLASLHDERGNVAIAGLVEASSPEVDYPEDRLRDETGILDGVDWIGEGTLTERMWTKPAVSVLAIDSVPVKDASNTLVPSARAKVSLRIAPGQDPTAALAALREHLIGHAPWGAHVEVSDGQLGAGMAVDMAGERAATAIEAITEAFGVAPVQAGVGGSIPIAAEFQALNPDALVLLTAVVDPTSRMHGIDESLHLGDFAKACHAEALLLQGLGS